MVFHSNDCLSALYRYSYTSSAAVRKKKVIYCVHTDSESQNTLLVPYLAVDQYEWEFSSKADRIPRCRHVQCYQTGSTTKIGYHYQSSFLGIIKWCHATRLPSLTWESFELDVSYITSSRQLHMWLGRSLPRDCRTSPYSPSYILTTINNLQLHSLTK